MSTVRPAWRYAHRPAHRQAWQSKYGPRDAILEIFRSTGAQGAYYDPSDIRTLFQKADFTQPVTAPGQLVAGMLDKSGNGWHVSQSVSASAPEYQINTYGNPCLLFDGSDDQMLSKKGITWALGSSDSEIIATGRYITTSGYDGFYIRGPNSRYESRQILLGGYGNSWNVGSNSYNNFLSTNPTDMSIISSVYTNGNCIGRTNTGIVQTIATPSLNTVDYGVALGSLNGNYYGNIEFYGAAEINQILTDAQRKSVFSQFANKSGAVLS